MPTRRGPSTASYSRILALPDETRLFLCHDYKAPGRDDYRWETTVGEQRRTSVHVHDGVSEDAFVTMREQRDAVLSVAKLLLPSIQVNIRAGHFDGTGKDPLTSSFVHKGGTIEPTINRKLRP